MSRNPFLINRDLDTVLSDVLTAAHAAVVQKTAAALPPKQAPKTVIAQDLRTLADQVRTASEPLSYADLMEAL